MPNFSVSNREAVGAFNSQGSNGACPLCCTAWGYACTSLRVLHGTVHCTMCTQCTLTIVCTVYTLQCLHSVHCTSFTVYTVYNVQHWCTLYWHLYTSGCIEILMYMCTSVQITQYTFVHNWLICSILVQLNICTALLYSCTHQSSCGLVTTLCSSHKAVRLLLWSRPESRSWLLPQQHKCKY